jgi:hypothetical protein
MNAISYLVVAAALGVDYGWQQMDSGEWEYIVQVEPALLSSLADGERIVSELPRELQGVRRVVLRVGTDEVPRGRIPDVVQASGQQTVRRAGERWVGDTAIPLAKEELPDRPRLDFVPFNEPTRVAAGSRWTNEPPPLANRDRDPPVLSVPNRMFNSPKKKTATEISSIPRLENDVEPYPPAISRDNRFAADSGFDNRRPLPGPASDDAEYPPERDFIDSRSQPYEQGSRLADRGTDSTFSGAQVRRPNKPTASIPAGGKGDSPAGSAPLSSSGFPTILALFLFASIGGNLYLGWLARDFYWRYRDLAWEMRSGSSTSE